MPVELVPLDLRLHERQSLAFTSPATEILYGGAAGGGKSHLMRAAAIGWCTAIEGLQVYIFRRISEDLVKNHIEGPNGFRALLAPWVLAGLCQIVEGEIRFWNGAKIYLCHCQDDRDRFKYLGAEIHVLLIDELTTFSEVVYRFLRSRVRAVGLKVSKALAPFFPRIICGSNPGNVGHHWVKNTFIDGHMPMEVWQAPPVEGGMLRQYIPAKLEDNPSMTANDPFYGDRLSGLGHPELVRAMREGDWNVVLGAFFPEWRTTRHVIAPFWPPADWTQFVAADWGSASPFSIGWYAVASGQDGPKLPNGEFIPRGCLVRWQEWYGMTPGHPNVGLRLVAEELGNGIRAREAGFEAHYGKGSPWRISFRVMDPSAFAENGGPSIVQRMKVVFREADNKREAGWDAVRSRLVGHATRDPTTMHVGDDGTPMLLITANCVHAIRTLPAVVGDNVKLDDVDTDSEDHAPDEIRYACMSRPWARPSVVPKPIKTLPQMTFDDFKNFHDQPEARRTRI